MDADIVMDLVGNMEKKEPSLDVKKIVAKAKKAQKKKAQKAKKAQEKKLLNGSSIGVDVDVGASSAVPVVVPNPPAVDVDVGASSAVPVVVPNPPAPYVEVVMASPVKEVAEEKKEMSEEKKEALVIMRKREEPRKGLLTVVECDSPVKDVLRILSEIGVGRVGPGSVISSMGRDTNKTIVLMTIDLFEHLENIDPSKMETITKVEEYDERKCFPPNMKNGETFDIFCRLTKTRLTNDGFLNSAFVKNDVIEILEFMRDIDILPNGSYFVDVPTPDRRVGSGGQVEFFFIRLNLAAHGKTAMKVKAFLNGHLLTSSMTVISTFWSRGKIPVKDEKREVPHTSKILQRPDRNSNDFRSQKFRSNRK